MVKSHCPWLVGTLLLVGCSTVERKATGGRIVLQPWEETDGSACTVGYELRYTSDTPPHERVINVRTGSEVEPGIPAGALRGGVGAVTIPRPERDPKVDRSLEDEEVFRVRLMNFGQCESVRSGDRHVATVEIELGECVSGSCPEVAYRPPAGESTAVFRLARDAP